jgi:diphthine-ammonia ligase
MKFVALVSGGKDSIYSILQCIENGHDLVACVHLGAPTTDSDTDSTSNSDDEESYMYQSAASEAVKVLVGECLGVPLIFYPRKGTSINTSLVYEDEMRTTTSTAESPTSQSEQMDQTDRDSSAIHDEVEDLYNALRQVQQQFPDVSAVCSGAILSTYQRIRFVKK